MIYLLGCVFLGAVVYWQAPMVLALTLGAWTYVVRYPWQIALAVSGYFLTGAGWSLVGWWSAETERARDARERYKAFDSKRSWDEWKATAKTNPDEHKVEIIWSIACWPIDMLWTAMADYVRRIGRRIYEQLRVRYQGITDRIWG